MDDLTLEIPRGIVGLLGPNGAGKSTFIKALLGLVEPNGGDVRVRGLDPREDLVRVRDMMGYMPEHDCLINELNAVRLVSYMGQISGVKSATAIQRAHEVLDFVNMGEGGNRQRNIFRLPHSELLKNIWAADIQAVHDGEDWAENRS